MATEIMKAPPRFEPHADQIAAYAARLTQTIRMPGGQTMTVPISAATEELRLLLLGCADEMRRRVG